MEKQYNGERSHFFSSLLNRPIIDHLGNAIGTLWDMDVRPGEVFPAVAWIVVRSRRKYSVVPWSDVDLFTPFVISLKATAGPPAAFQPGRGEILMRRDILDKQIVDVDGARVVRVNDLKLESIHNRMCVTAADVGLKGIARRLGQERLWRFVSRLWRGELPHQEISWKFVQHLESNLSHLTLTVARDRLEDMHPADIAQIISQIPVRSVPTVLEGIDIDTASEAIMELDPEVGGRVLSQLEVGHASDILEEMHPDEAADVLAELPEEKSKELLEQMDEEDAEKVQELLEHEEDTAGGLMNNEFIHVPPQRTVAQALEEVRRLGDEIDMVYYVYVLDEQERLLGVLTLRDILTTPGDSPVSEVMRTKVKSVSVDSDPLEVLELIDRYKLLAVPVLDEEERMAGIVTSGDVVERFLPLAIKWKRSLGARTF